MLKILDRYLVREIVPPLADGAGRPHLRADDAADPPEGERLVEKGVAWTIDPPRAVDARAAGAQRHHSDGAALRHPVRARTALGRPRVRGAAGLRHQRVPHACGRLCCCRRWRPRRPPTRPSSPCRTPTRPIREITFNVVASRAESDIKPRVFFQNFPNRVLYVRDIQPGGGWRDVFLADDTQPDQTTVYFAEQRPAGDRPREARRCELVLENGHACTPRIPAGRTTTTSARSRRLSINMDADTVFPRTQARSRATTR